MSYKRGIHAYYVVFEDEEDYLKARLAFLEARKGSVDTMSSLVFFEFLQADLNHTNEYRIERIEPISANTWSLNTGNVGIYSNPSGTVQTYSIDCDGSNSVPSSIIYRITPTTNWNGNHFVTDNVGTYTINYDTNPFLEDLTLGQPMGTWETIPQEFKAQINFLESDKEKSKKEEPEEPLTRFELLDL